MEKFLACGEGANSIRYIQRLARQNAIDGHDRPVREFDRFLRDEHQVSIQRLALVFESCVQNTERASLRASCPIRKPHSNPWNRSRLFRHARQHANTIPQQIRIQRRVNVRLHDRRIHPYTRSILNFVVDGHTDNNPVDLFQRLVPDGLDTCCKNCFGWPLSEPQPTENAIAHRVGQVKSELSVTESVELLHKQRAQNLIGTHAFSALVFDHPTVAQVPPNQLSDCRILLEYAIDRL
jgi:hypothetical protein